MERIRYEPQVKTAIVAAVKDARKRGKTWAKALEPAKQAGYKGTAGGLVQFVRSSSTPKKPSAPAASVPKKTKGKKAKTKAKRAVAARPVSSPVVKPSSSSLDINALVHKAVADAVVTALEGLVASLKRGK